MLKEILEASGEKIKMDVRNQKGEDVDIVSIHIWVASDDLINIACIDEANNMDWDSNFYMKSNLPKQWNGDCYSFFDNDISLDINIGGKKTTLQTYIERDECYFRSIKGLKGRTQRFEKYGMNRNVYVIDVKTNSSKVKAVKAKFLDTLTEK